MAQRASAAEARATEAQAATADQAASSAWDPDPKVPAGDGAPMQSVLLGIAQNCVVQCSDCWLRYMRTSWE